MKINLATQVGMMLLATGLLAQNEAKPQPVCQGEYSALGKDSKGDPKATRLDRWHMDSMQDGSYSVDVEMERPKFEEHRFLTKEFKPISVVLVGSVPSDVTRIGRLPMTIKCNYGSTELNCHATLNGSSWVVTLPQRQPYAFVPTFEVLTFDLPWAFQAIVSQAERTIGHKTAVPLIVLEDGDTEKSTALRVQEVVQVEYRGREAIEILGQKILAHKFRLGEAKESGGLQDFWMSESGIPLSMTLGDSGARISLTEYQGLPLIP